MRSEIERNRLDNELLLKQYEEKWSGCDADGNDGGNSDGIQFVDDMEYLRKQLEEERSRGDKLKKMSHNVLKDQRTFGDKLKEYEQSLKQSLLMTERTLNAEIHALKNELRDYQAHIDTAARVKKSAT